MSLQTWLTIAILVVMFALLIKSRVPPVIVFVGALTLTITFRLAPLDQSLKGFSNSGMLTVGVLLMVARGMYRTGAISLIAEKVVGRPKTLLAAQLRILPPVAIGSAFLNNTPLVAMFIPVIRDLARTCRNLNASQLYLPLSFASIQGGTCTLIGTSTNLIVAGMVTAALAQGAVGGLRDIEMFDPAFVGVPVTVLGLAFLMAASRFLLPKDRKADEAALAARWYRAEFEVEQRSSLVGRNLTQVGWADTPGLEVLAILRRGGEPIDFDEALLQAGDRIAFASDLDSLPDLWNMDGLTAAWTRMTLEQPKNSRRLVEAVVAPKAPFVGRRLSDGREEDSPYNVNVMGMSRDGRPVEGHLGDHEIEAGDVALLEVDEDFFSVERAAEDFSLTRRLTGVRIMRYERAAAAITITAAMVAVVALGWMSMLNAALLATGAMLLTGCLGPREAGESVDWSTLVIIASAIGLESAVTGSGLSDRIATGLTALGGSDPRVALAVVFLGCALMDTMITNVASAVFMFPIALGMASNLGVSAMPFTMTVLVGASCSFISPMGYQTNLMVYGPGGYRFGDFVRVGVPLTAIVGIVTVFLASLVWPF